MAENDLVTITIPEQVVRQSITESLPLSVKPETGLLAGSLDLDSIDTLELGDNSALVHGLIRGKDLVLTTRIGNRDLRLRLGEVQLPLRCTFTFRFDPQQKNLYITPHLADPASGAPPEQADKAVPVLALLNNREYRLSLANIERFQARVGRTNLALEMEPVDVRVFPGELVVKMKPMVRKTD